MATAVEFALAHGWSDEDVAELERHVGNKDMEAALALVRAQDMPSPERENLKAKVVLAIVS